MSAPAGSDKADDVIAEIRATRGDRILPELEYSARIDPEFMRVYNAFVEHALGYAARGDTGALPVKTKELIAIALLCARQDATAARHIRRAYQEGVSRREVMEALAVSMQITGAPSWRFGATAMMQADEDAG
jgi:alkylhydroperoxidase/carboxymuconolactone decarboxylase family protein YurZ